MKRTLKWIAAIFMIAVVGFGISWIMNSPAKEVRGTWETEGYGLALDISRGFIDVYQTSDLHCHLDQRIPGHLWLVEYLEGATFALENDRLRIAVAGTLNPIYATRTDTLPAACNSELPDDAQATFDVMWEVMQTHYAHFDLHDVDWAARKAFRPIAQLDDASLLAVFQDALTGLNDGHTYIATGDEVWSPSTPPAWFEDRIVVRDTSLAAVPDKSTLDARGVQVGWAAPGIGYVILAHMQPGTRLGQRAADMATDTFAEVATYFADADAVIVDIRYNPGGSDDVSLAYAGYFTDTALPVFTKVTRTASGYSEPYTAMLRPQRQHLAMPTVVLTSGYTGSAAEIFTMAMRELPQVTVIGEATSGGLSDVLNFELPNGWELGLSHQVYRTMNGDNFEAIGIPPDVTEPVDTDAARAGRDAQLEAAITYLRDRL